MSVAQEVGGYCRLLSLGSQEVFYRIEKQIFLMEVSFKSPSQSKKGIDLWGLTTTLFVFNLLI